MIETLIIEDEKPAARRLARMLGNNAGIKVTAMLHSVEEALQWFQENPAPSLIFADIVLGDGLSFDIFERIQSRPFIIYTTAFDNYTLRAFKLNSIDYLLKPVEATELTRAIEKYQSFLPSDNDLNIKELKALLKQKSNILSRVVVKTGSHLKVLNVADASCFYAENKTVFLFQDGRHYPTDFTLDDLEETLDPQYFFRTSRQFIVNARFIDRISTVPYYRVLLSSQPDTEITVSRDRVKAFKEWLAGGQ